MTVSIKLDDEINDRVQNLAVARQLSADRILHEAVAQYLSREEARESFKEEALASLVAYQQTGRHLTGDEVRTWLSRWGTEAETDLPDCHD